MWKYVARSENEAVQSCLQSTVTPALLYQQLLGIDTSQLARGPKWAIGGGEPHREEAVCQIAQDCPHG